MDLGAKIRLNIWAKQRLKHRASPMLLLAPKSFPRHCSCWFSQVFYVSSSGFLVFRFSGDFSGFQIFSNQQAFSPTRLFFLPVAVARYQLAWTRAHPGVWWNNWYCCANILHFRFAPNPPKWAVTFPLKTDTICDGQSSGVHLLYKVQLPWENTPWQKKPTLLMM